MVALSSQDNSKPVNSILLMHLSTYKERGSEHMRICLHMQLRYMQRHEDGKNTPEQKFLIMLIKTHAKKNNFLWFVLTVQQLVEFINSKYSNVTRESK